MLSGLFKRKPRRSDWLQGVIDAERMSHEDDNRLSSILFFLRDEMYCASNEYNNGVIDYINNEKDRRYATT